MPNSGGVPCVFWNDSSGAKGHRAKSFKGNIGKKCLPLPVSRLYPIRLFPSSFFFPVLPTNPPAGRNSEFNKNTNYTVIRTRTLQR